MTRTRDLFTISLYLTVCLAAVMLAAAEGYWLLPAGLTVPIAIAAFWYVERQGLALPTWAANSLGIVAILVSLIELAVRDIEGRILFGAHLLVYLSWIVLWQPKGSQQRWGLIALAVLQVAVGSVLTIAGTYGLSMGLFLVLTVWTLVLLQLAEAEQRYAAAAAPPAEPLPRGREMLLAPGRVAALGRATVGRWPTRQVVAAVAVTVFGATIVGSAFFLLVPRFEVGRYNFDETLAPLARQRVTGFTERVRLGSFGEILESSTPVFEVRLVDTTDDSPVDLETYAASLGLDEPLFRGLTLGDYNRGEWTTAHSEGASELPSWSPSPGLIRQEYRLRPLASDVRTRSFVQAARERGASSSTKSIPRARRAISGRSANVLERRRKICKTICKAWSRSAALPTLPPRWRAPKASMLPQRFVPRGYLITSAIVARSATP
jgi:hypothetical protein